MTEEIGCGDLEPVPASLREAVRGPSAKRAFARFGQDDGLNKLPALVKMDSSDLREAGNLTPNPFLNRRDGQVGLAGVAKFGICALSEEIYVRFAKY